MAGVNEKAPEVVVDTRSTPTRIATAAHPPRRLRAARRRKLTTLRVVVLLVVAAVFLLPLVGLADFSTRQGNKRSFDAWTTLFHFSQLNAQAPGLVSGLWVTLALCVVTSVLTVALLVPTMTWVRLRIPVLRKPIEFISLLPLTIPAIVLVVGLAPIYRGIAHSLGTANIWLCFAYVILALPFASRAIDAGLSAIDVKTLSEAARSLGCSWGKVMWSIVLPNIRSAVIGAVFLTVALVLGEFTVADLLNKNNLSVALYTLGLSSNGDPRLTTAVSLTMLVFGFLLMFAFSFIGNGTRKARRAVQTPTTPGGIAALQTESTTP